MPIIGGILVAIKLQKDWFSYNTIRKKEWLLVCWFFDEKKFLANIEHIGVPHASFPNPNSRQQKPRQSIEVPILIWYE